MCYSSAAGAGEKSQKALNRAVLVLLVPAVTMLVGFVGMAFVYRRERDARRELATETQRHRDSEN